AMDRLPIRQLAPSLVNRIAAGEVIERPASVVKELVENSIDAGSTHITVEITDGGRESIRIIDDGCGIPPQELPLPFAAHATSKLTCDEDLFAIRTMGFRGEALASIGSVSHARILTRTPDSDAAWEIVNRGGEISDPQASAGSVGTTIEIRNLFYNVPARRKFLKGAQTEYGHISDMVTRLALPNPQVGFKLISSGRTTLDLPAVSDPEQRLLAAWPEAFAEQRLPVDARDAELRIRGVIGLPELASQTAKHQHLYVNGRGIKDRFIQHALKEAYRGLTEPGRHPAAILLIELPPDEVDVNVHPTKSEVRFRDGGRVYSLVLSAVRERLLGSDLTPRAQPRRDFASFANVTPIDAASAAEPARSLLQQQLADFFRAPQPAVTQMRLDDATSSSSASMPLAPFAIPIASSAPSPVTPVMRETPTEARPPSSASGTVNAIQLHNSYLVAESDDGLVIIDQHALHERIMFEQLLKQVTRGPLESQRLLIPITLEASPQQIELLDSLAPLLGKLGIEAGAFGPTTIAIQAFPSFLEKLDPAAFLRDLLERAESNLIGLSEEEALHEVLDMMSCKAAVKAGDSLTPQEIDALLAQRDLIDRSSNCPHGRPTTLRLSLRDLEKQFKRTGF
ncbi:MAG TPA: DNA mismatch repair endonuclease MutL, partial [Tepidisphaeraceae bacterium]|nr:DNA mismatch repair endonuclease MutL [Tepidisphaeraceae bacterium]